VKLEDGLRQMIDYIRTRGPRPFDYRLPLEIVTDRTPTTWKERLL
jgi:UDP-glucose 4-epimerase